MQKSLSKRAAPKVVVADLAREDMAEAVEDAFRYDRLVLATTTYNAGIFPFMREFINHLTERGFKTAKSVWWKNGTWAPTAAKTMKGNARGCKNLEFARNDRSNQIGLERRLKSTA